jgi:hypothetical protein
VSSRTQARAARSMKSFTTYARHRLANYAKPASSWESYNNTPRDGLARLFCESSTRDSVLDNRGGIGDGLNAQSYARRANVTGRKDGTSRGAANC